MDTVTTGFSTRVAVNNSQLSCTSLSLSENNTLIESSGGYGGKLKGTSNTAVSGPFFLDTGEISLSLSFEPSENQLFNFINLIRERNTASRVDIWSGTNSHAYYEECFLQSAAIKCSENSLVSMDIGFLVQKRPMIGGTFGGVSGRYSTGTPVKNQVPYWKTKVTGLPNDDVLSWDISFSQTMVKKYFCHGAATNNERPLAKYVNVGPLNIELNVEILVSKHILDLSDIFMNKGSGIEIMIGTTRLVALGKFTTNTTTPIVSDSGGRQVINVGYRIFEIK